MRSICNCLQFFKTYVVVNTKYWPQASNLSWALSASAIIKMPDWLFGLLGGLLGRGGKRHFMLNPIKDTVVILGRHSQALGRANSGTKATKTALSQVNVKFSSIQTLGHAITGFTQRYR